MTQHESRLLCWDTSAPLSLTAWVLLLLWFIAAAIDSTQVGGLAWGKAGEKACVMSRGEKHQRRMCQGGDGSGYAPPQVGWCPRAWTGTLWSCTMSNPASRREVL
jgi:hypothetical protein